MSNLTHRYVVATVLLTALAMSAQVRRCFCGAKRFEQRDRGRGVAKAQDYYTLSYSPTNTSVDAVKFSQDQDCHEGPQTSCDHSLRLLS
jgi:hypothetical protein